jgi:phage terminase large subunit
MHSLTHSGKSDAPSDATPLFPFTEQEPFLGSDRKFYGYISGVGAGKTHAGVLRAAWNMLEWNPGEMGAIVAPTSTMVKDVIIPLFREVGLLDEWDYKSAHTEEPGIHAPNGSRALILSADNQRTVERLAGLNLAWWWLDEGSRTQPRALEILTQRLRIGAYRNGFVTTTPMGKDHIYDFFVDEDGGETTTHGDADVHYHGRGDRAAILRVPTYANPFTPADYKEDMETKEGQTYEREILGKFVNFEGLVYPWFDADSHVAPDDLPDTFDKTIYGLDFGGSVPTAIVALRQAGEEWYAVDEFYESRVTDDTIAAELSRMYDDYGRGPVYADHEPRTIEKLNREHIQAKEADKDVDNGIRHVNGLADRLHVVDRCSNLINEFNQYRYKDGSDTVLKENDHLMDALRYALFSDDTAKEGGAVAIDW